MSSSSHPRLNSFVYLGTLEAGEIEGLISGLEARKVQCVIDLRRSHHGDSERDFAPLRVGANSRGMYFARLTELGAAAGREEPSRAMAWAARTALRYRSCLLTRGLRGELEAVRSVADLVGLEVIDLEAGPREPREADRS